MLFNLILRNWIIKVFAVLVWLNPVCALGGELTDEQKADIEKFAGRKIDWSSVNSDASREAQRKRVEMDRANEPTSKTVMRAEIKKVRDTNKELQAALMAAQEDLRTCIEIRGDADSYKKQERKFKALIMEGTAGLLKARNDEELLGASEKYQKKLQAGVLEARATVRECVSSINKGGSHE